LSSVILSFLTATTSLLIWHFDFLN
jgi:hypothetical protein